MLTPEQSMIDFLNFCKKFHEQIGCGTDCEVAHFINALSAFLTVFLEEKTLFKNCILNCIKNYILSQKGEIVLKNC